MFANLCKKRKAIFSFIALFAIIAVPFTIKAVKNKKYCQKIQVIPTYISYKITPPEDSCDFESSKVVGIVISMEISEGNLSRLIFSMM